MDSVRDNLSSGVEAALAAIPRGGALFAAKAAPTAVPAVASTGELLEFMGQQWV